MDLSLSAEGTIYPAEVTIIKEASPEGTTNFSFTGDLGPFALVDDGTNPNYLTWDEISVFGDYIVTETVPEGWDLLGISCEIKSYGIWQLRCRKSFSHTFFD